MSGSMRRLMGLGLPCLFAYLAAIAPSLYANHSPTTVAALLAWPAVIAGLLLLLPEVLAVILAIAVVFGHVAGAYTLLTPMMGGGWYQIANGMFLASGVALGCGLCWWARTAGRAGSGGGVERLAAWQRWPLIVGLLGAAWVIVQ